MYENLEPGETELFEILLPFIVPFISSYLLILQLELPLLVIGKVIN